MLEPSGQCWAAALLAAAVVDLLIPTGRVVVLVAAGLVAVVILDLHHRPVLEQVRRLQQSVLVDE